MQFQQAKVQNSTRTTCPRSAFMLTGSEFSQVSALISGAFGAAAVAAEEAKKAAMRAKQKEAKLVAANPLLAKQKAGGKK